MLPRVREWLVLVLIVLLPFHAFFVTVGTRLLVGPYHAPLPWLAGWKEMLLGIVLVVALVEIMRSFLVPRSSLSVDVLDGPILGLFVLGVFVSIFNFPFSIFHFALGARYTLFPLFLFFVLRRVPWSERFLLLTSYFLLLVGVIIATYGFLTLFLPQSFFTWLGYSDLHSTYLPGGPLAAFQMLEGTGIRRMQATFAGPNQLGMWLLISWSIGLVFLMKNWMRCVTLRDLPVMVRDDPSIVLRIPHHDTGKSSRSATSASLRMACLSFSMLATSIALIFTFSRAAWVGAAAMVLALLTTRHSLLTRWKLLVTGSSFLVMLLVASAVVRPRSTMEHLRRPLQALQLIAAHPLGLGLGSAGPASNRTSDPCVFLEAGADVSWAKDRPDLCVFAGDQQIQPVGRTCRCPLLPENWYLQVGVELGVLGLLLYMALVFLIVRSLCPTPYVLLPFVGISVAALFLHAWEDSAVAYTVWILLAIEVSFLNGAWIHRRS